MELSREQLIKELVRELKSVRDDRDFVGGTLHILRTEEKWVRMLDYIQMARRMGDEVTQDDVLTLALLLKSGELK